MAPTTQGVKRLLRSLCAALLGGVLAMFVAGLCLLAMGYPLYESQPAGRVDPSAAVGESLATLLRAAVVFAIGAGLGVVADRVLRRRRARRA